MDRYGGHIRPTLVKIHSSPDELASMTWLFVNNAALNTGVQTHFHNRDFVSFGFVSRCGMLDHMAVLLFTFSSTLFSIRAIPICILTSKAWECPFTHSFTNTVFLYTFSLVFNRIVTDLSVDSQTCDPLPSHPRFNSIYHSAKKERMHAY